MAFTTSYQAKIQRLPLQKPHGLCDYHISPQVHRGRGKVPHLYVLDILKNSQHNSNVKFLFKLERGLSTCTCFFHSADIVRDCQSCHHEVKTTMLEFVCFQIICGTNSRIMFYILFYIQESLKYLVQFLQNNYFFCFP